MTASACSARRSTTLPFPSSPHWAPTTTMPGMPLRECTRCLRRRAVLAPVVVAEERQGVAADLDDPRHGPGPDLLGELLGIEVRGDDERALVLVPRVDDRVELLEHPLARVLGAEVVEVEQVD